MAKQPKDSETKSPLRGVKGIIATLNRAVDGHEAQPEALHVACLSAEQAKILLDFIGWELGQWMEAATVLRLPEDAHPKEVIASAEALVATYESQQVTIRDLAEQLGIEVELESADPGKVM